MIKKKKKIKVPAAEFGLEETNKLIEALSTLGSQGIAAATNGQHETTGQSIGSALSSGLSMMGAGASLGSIIPGIGTGIGAAIGATAGILTSGLSGGKDPEVTSFTDYDEGELAGFLRPGKRRQQKRERERLKQNAYGNRSAVAGTAYLQNKFAEDYGQMDTNTFANGGITNQLAYVDDGELISTPDGTISKVPELGRPTDSNLVSLPEGSKILSDTLKVPGTKKTFAQVGEEMMATKKSKFNDIYAQNAAKLNDMNNKSIHDQLFEIQEAVKAKKGIKRKYKNAVIAARTGDEIINDSTQIRGISQLPFMSYLRPVDEFLNSSFRSGLESAAEAVNNSSLPIRIVEKSAPVYSGGELPEVTVTSNIPTTQTTSTTKNVTVPKPVTRRKNANGLTPYSNYTQVGMNYYGTDAAADYMTRREWTLRNQNDPRVQQLLKDINAGKYGNIGGNTLTWNDYVRLSMDGKRGPVHNAIMALQIPDNTTTTVAAAPAPLASTPLSITRPGGPAGSSLDNGTAPTPPKKARPVIHKPDDNDNGILPNLTEALSTISGLAPIVSNLLERPEYQDPNYNPYANTIARTMRNRRFNINPAVRDMERNRATANYNASQFNTNTGANLAYSLQNASNVNRAIADLRAQESNINNAYLGEYANMLNNLGQQWAAETTRVDDANMANRAQARNINRAGLSGLSQWMQNRELMRNQRNRDNMMMALYDPFLEAGFTTADLTNFRNWLRRTNG